MAGRSPQAPQERLRDLFARRLAQSPNAGASWQTQVAATLPACLSIDVSGAFAFFWELPSEESTFSLRGFPNASYVPLSGPRPGGAGRNAIFLEGRIPVAKLAAGVLAEASGRMTEGIALAQLMRAQRARGRPSMHVEGPPDLLFMEQQMEAR